MATSPTYRNDAKPIRKQILPADTTAWVDLIDNTTGTKAVRVEALNLCSDEPTNAVNIQLSRYDGTTNYLIGTVRAVALSGTDGAAARVDVLTTLGTLAPDGIRVIEVGAGGKLQAKSLATVTAAKTVSLTGWYMKFEADA